MTNLALLLETCTRAYIEPIIIIMGYNYSQLDHYIILFVSWMHQSDPVIVDRRKLIYPIDQSEDAVYDCIHIAVQSSTDVFETHRPSSHRYAGALPRGHRHTSTANLFEIGCATGSQCSV